MTTISELYQTVADVEARVQQERQANMNDVEQLRTHIMAVRSHVENAMSTLNGLSDAVERMFADRSDSLAATIGTAPAPTANVG
jgi:ABC-type transporter Mla subunit MlaD